MHSQGEKEITDPEPQSPADAATDWDESDDYRKRTVQCICPNCQRTHMVKMLWIGRGTPRIFCQSCRHICYFVENF